jgi:hypothetical protein
MLDAVCCSWQFTFFSNNIICYPFDHDTFSFESNSFNFHCSVRGVYAIKELLYQLNAHLVSRSAPGSSSSEFIANDASQGSANVHTVEATLLSLFVSHSQSRASIATAKLPSPISQETLVITKRLRCKTGKHIGLSGYRAPSLKGRDRASV